MSGRHERQRPGMPERWHSLLRAVLPTQVRARHASGAEHRRGRSFGVVVLFTVGFLFASAGAAWAYFSATTSGTYAVAKAGSITAPTKFSSSTLTSTSVKLTWTAPTTPPPSTFTFVLTGTIGTGSTCKASMTSSTHTCFVKGLSGGTPYT
ncbi:MAG: hypothetical protein ACRD6W_13590, partial [Nitrososphaerales archaeon]